MANSNSGEWCTIESDPGVFTEMLEELGCKTVQLEELWSLDDDSLAQLTSSDGKVYGLIFLFKWLAGGSGDGKNKADRIPLSENEIPDEFFFAHQVTTNACATQAILSVLFNSDLSGEELGSTLKGFQDFTDAFPPNLKGEAISSSEEIRKVHNRFARPDSFLQEGKVYNLQNHQHEDVFHFVAYIPHEKSNTVFELDGLQNGPVKVGSYHDNDGWLQVARKAIQTRMSQMGNEIKFNLMAVVKDHRIGLKQQLILLEEKSSSDNENQKTANIAALTQEMESQNQKRQRWKLENQRRRHNYLPLCVELFKGLSKVGKLNQLTQEGKDRHLNKLMSKKAKI